MRGEARGAMLADTTGQTAWTRGRDFASFFMGFEVAVEDGALSEGFGTDVTFVGSL